MKEKKLQVSSFITHSENTGQISGTGQGLKLGTTMKQIQLVVRAGFKPGTTGLQVRCADHLAMLPPLY